MSNFLILPHQLFAKKYLNKEHLLFVGTPTLLY